MLCRWSPYPLALALACSTVPGCDSLTREPSSFTPGVAIRSPQSGSTQWDALTTTVRIAMLDCQDAKELAVHVNGTTRTAYQSEFELDSEDALEVASAVSAGFITGAWWPAQIHAEVQCGSPAVLLRSPIIEHFAAPFSGATFLDRPAGQLLAGPDGLLVVSTAGLRTLHSNSDASLSHQTSDARAWVLDGEVYYYAACDHPLLCQPDSPTFFHLTYDRLQVQNSARLECPPIALGKSSDGQLVGLFGECDNPFLRWSAPDLSNVVDRPLGAIMPLGPPRSFGQLRRLGDELVLLAVDGDAVVVAASASPGELVVRSTPIQVPRAGPVDITADGARGVVYAPSTGVFSMIDMATGQVVASAAVPDVARSAVIGIGFIPNSRRALLAQPRSLLWLDEAQVSTAEVAAELTRVTPIGTGRLAAVTAQGAVWFTDEQGQPIRVAAELADDWTLTAPFVATANGRLYAAFAPATGPLLVHWDRFNGDR